MYEGTSRNRKIGVFKSDSNIFKENYIWIDFDHKFLSSKKRAVLSSSEVEWNLQLYTLYNKLMES